MNKYKVTIIGLAVTLFFVSQYVLLDKMIQTKNQDVLESYKAGYSKGLTDAVTTLYKQTEHCNPTSITVGNLTKYVFDLSCLKNSTKTG